MKELHGPRDGLKSGCKCKGCAQKRIGREKWLTAPDIDTLFRLNRAFLRREIDISLHQLGGIFDETTGLVKQLLRLHNFGIFTTNSQPMGEPHIKAAESSRRWIEQRQIEYLDFQVPKQDVQGSPYQGTERFCKALLQNPNLFTVIAYPQYNANECVQWHEAFQCYRHESSFPDNGGSMYESRKAKSKGLLAAASWHREASIREYPDMVSGTEDMPTWYIKCLPIFVFCTAARWNMNFSVIDTVLACAQDHLTPSFQEVHKEFAAYDKDCACVTCAKRRADMKAWESVPLHDLETFFKLNLDFLHGEVTCTPHNNVPLEDESLLIVSDLCRLNELGLMTTMSSPFCTHWTDISDGSVYAHTQRPWLEFMIPSTHHKGLPTRAKIEKLASLFLTHPKILATVILPRYEEALEPRGGEGKGWANMLAYSSHTCEHRSSLNGPHPTGRQVLAPDRESLIKGTAEWEDVGKIACSRPASIWVAEQFSKGFAEHYRPIFFYMIARYWEDESNLYFYDIIRKLAIDAGFEILFPDPRLPKGESDKPQKPQETSKSRKTTIARVTKPTRVTKPEQTKRVLRSTKKGK